ncbi:protein kinase, ATP binding site-containing protein [Tanacetum coccineum]
MVNLEKFLIPLKDIELATEEFQQKNEIAGGEYSKLYREQLSESWENRTAAFKRFTGYLCDGKKEFLNELKFISNMNHIPFLGYCDEGEEMIMVYEYPICMDAARGLNYLHSGLGQHETVIHGSFMHSNILLDGNLKAKICGFEISELIPGNQSCQQVYKPHTNGMISQKDPIYLQTGFLKAESDIYSFDSLTDPAIRDQIGGQSFRMIEELACKCLSFNMKDRPTMDKLVKTIENALDIHEASRASKSFHNLHTLPTTSNTFHELL